MSFPAKNKTKNGEQWLWITLYTLSSILQLSRYSLYSGCIYTKRMELKIVDRVVSINYQINAKFALRHYPYYICRRYMQDANTKDKINFS